MNFLGLIIAVTFIGGFLFSLLWEAGGRYVFPYFVFLITAAASGIGMTLNKCNQLYFRYGAKYDGRSHNELNSNS